MADKGAKVIRFGRKEVFLPNFTITLLRKRSLSPYHARFQVPLSFSKLDLRDYLYHAYALKTFNIRSLVIQSPVRDSRFAPRRWFRPQSKKFMTVEMEQPFVWPESPEDWAPWGKKEHEEQVRAQTRQAEEKEVRREEREEMRRQVREVMEGKRAWRPRDDMGGLGADGKEYKIRV